MKNTVAINRSAAVVSLALLIASTGSGVGAEEGTQMLSNGWPQPVRQASVVQPVATQQVHRAAHNAPSSNARIPQNALRSRISQPARQTVQPAPVRQAGHIHDHHWHEPVAVMSPDLHQHQIIQAPGRKKPSTIQRHHEKAQKYHPPHLSWHHFQQSQAKLPMANQRETWKTPYSYGHFGASGKRHWSKHHGYRDRYTEWRRN